MTGFSYGINRIDGSSKKRFGRTDLEEIMTMFVHKVGLRCPYWTLANIGKSDTLSCTDVLFAVSNVSGDRLIVAELHNVTGRESAALVSQRLKNTTIMQLSYPGHAMVMVTEKYLTELREVKRRH